MARGTAGVTNAHELFTIHLAPDQIVAALGVDFDDWLSAGDVEILVEKLEHRIRAAQPQIMTLLIKPTRHART